MRYKVTIEYDGLKYFGWQRQKNRSATIQEIIENALKKLTQENIKITGAGRTDACVSAYNQVAHFDTNIKIEPKKFLHSINSILPPSIVIKSIKKVSNDFHARYDAVRREYVYYMTTRDMAISYAHFYKLNYNPDFKIINDFIVFLKTNKYFRSLCKNKSDKHDFQCRIYDISIRQIKSKQQIILKISADRFLHSMVRAIAGCIVDLGRGRLGLKQTISSIKKGETLKIYYLPGNALFLNKIYY